VQILFQLSFAGFGRLRPPNGSDAKPLRLQLPVKLSLQRHCTFLLSSDLSTLLQTEYLRLNPGLLIEYRPIDSSLSPQSSFPPCSSALFLGQPPERRPSPPRPNPPFSDRLATLLLDLLSLLYPQSAAFVPPSKMWVSTSRLAPHTRSRTRRWLGLKRDGRVCHHKNRQSSGWL
jgi:hypothetical protein